MEWWGILSWRKSPRSSFSQLCPWVHTGAHVSPIPLAGQREVTSGVLCVLRVMTQEQEWVMWTVNVGWRQTCRHCCSCTYVHRKWKWFEDVPLLCYPCMFWGKVTQEQPASGPRHMALRFWREQNNISWSFLFLYAVMTWLRVCRWWSVWGSCKLYKDLWDSLFPNHRTPQIFCVLRTFFL
jgi:hypothetical protein